MGWGYYDYGDYVSAAQKKANGIKLAASVARKQGREPSPVTIQGRKIVQTFWGKAWCDNLEAYRDIANRLPRGATYVRNGSVADLVIKTGRIEAIVAGSEAYTITIEIKELTAATWKKIKEDCATSIDSLLDLLAGKFSDGVMQRLTRQKGGLFPAPSEIKMTCSCPDYSYCCKHLAAVMYGVGARLDRSPDLLFTLRKVDPQELVSQAVADGNLEKELGNEDTSLAGTDLGALFGIELDVEVKKTKRRSKSAVTNSVAPKPSELKVETVQTTVTVIKKTAAKRKVQAKQAPSKEGVASSVQTTVATESTVKVRRRTVATTSKKNSTKGSKSAVAETTSPKPSKRRALRAK